MGGTIGVRRPHNIDNQNLEFEKQGGGAQHIPIGGILLDI